MQKNALYTIGHGNRKAEVLLSLLKEFRIQYLIDVRSKPYSRFHPQFSQKNIQQFLQENDITYVFMGNELGGRPEDVSCYSSDGKVDYNTIKTKDFFKLGIARLKAACSKDIRAAIMCSERSPCECHRTLLIGEVLHADNVQINHIDENGKLKDHVNVINELQRPESRKSLFDGIIDV